MNFDWPFFWQSLLTPSGPFLAGFGLTIVISIASMILAVIVGLIIAIAGRSRWTILRVLAGIYIWVIRGTPLLVQLVIIYLGLAAAGVFRFEDQYVFGFLVRGAVIAAIVGLTIHESAYISEIIRSGLEAVDRGQLEAAAALSMTPAQSMRWIILPQALRTIVPPFGNEFNSLMKMTSILSIIGVSEMFLVAQSISSVTFLTFEIFIVVAIYYLLLTTVWTFIQAAIERALNRRVGIPVPQSLAARAWTRFTTVPRVGGVERTNA
ncbi:polar amino acid ABC transporter permease [Pseudoclavibacter endophyticus]|uniref:Amino acid ABC transporter permease n=1 Tax=Pseudoclavibacter endophyticus TaxID=1778590 RepID=A0A6H9WBV7_9MICO|nr:amino acid ABC transporter permease [Pseudoclavibacter endophyticus]KAB1648153.1 amino acid ABC transporter permease [Pseudoclavibacter endophyticus]GGA70175.1 polar amino acid ABC transporter permease [Pseudoclavibacter endophyticus]